MGGALARQPEASMPFTFRSPWFISALAAAPTRDALDAGRRSIHALFHELSPALTGERLVNALEAGNVDARLTRAAYATENYQRLIAIKNRFDPGNLFRFNHNIEPTSSPRS